MSNKQRETQASNPCFRTHYENILGEGIIEEFKGVLVEIGKEAGLEPLSIGIQVLWSRFPR